MKNITYVIFATGILLLLAIFIYQNFIYYRIPFNPIKEYASESLVDFRLTKNLSGGETVSVKSQQSSTCNLILDYFSELKLIPLKEQDAQRMLRKKENDTYLTGMLTFNNSGEILLSDIFLDTPNILYIGSSITGFKKGYYKVMDSEINYNYLYDLITDTE